jgi:hypothetical protein
MQASCVLNQVIRIGLITSQLPSFQDTTPIATINLLHAIGCWDRFWHLVFVDLMFFKFSFLLPNTLVHFSNLWCVYKLSFAGFWQFDPLFWNIFILDRLPSKFNLFFKTTQFDWHIAQINESMEAPYNSRFYLEVQSSCPLAHIYGWKEDNICQSIWDKSEVLGPLCFPLPPNREKKQLHGKSTVQCPSGNWTVDSPLSTPNTALKKNPIPSAPLSTMQLLIGCMEILFLKLAATIFGLD